MNTINLTTDKASYIITEGDSLKINLNLDHTIDQQIQINYEVVSSNSNLNANDFENAEIPKGSVIFVPNELSKQIIINTHEDSTYESNEKFKVKLTTSFQNNDLQTLNLKNSNLNITLKNDDYRLTVTPSFDSLIYDPNINYYYDLKLDRPAEEQMTLKYNVLKNNSKILENQFVVIKVGEQTQSIPISLDQLKLASNMSSFQNLRRENSFSNTQKSNYIQLDFFSNDYIDGQKNVGTIISPEFTSPLVFETSDTSKMIDSPTSLLYYDQPIDENTDFSDYLAEQWGLTEENINYSKPLELTYSFDINPTQPTLFGNSFSDLQKTATRDALKEYEKFLNIKFKELEFNADQQADIYFTQVDSLDGATGNTVTLADNNNFLESGVVVQIANDIRSNTELNGGDYGYLILLHEIGHALGLKHPSDYSNGGDGNAPYLINSKDNYAYTIMSYNPNPKSWDLNPTTPAIYDISALQLLYGSNYSFNNDNTSYNIRKLTQAPSQTIWDTGGIDTINTSSKNVNQIIDLRMGHFSSIRVNQNEVGSVENNVAIAYGTQIEKAITGKGNDIIIGNQISNQLTGGDGHDNFIFSSELNSATNVDIITDFNPLKDKISLDPTIFQTFKNQIEVLDENFLNTTNSTQAQEKNQYLIFNQNNFSLYYDPDGKGGVRSIKFAILNNVDNLTANNFIIGNS